MPLRPRLITSSAGVVAALTMITGCATDSPPQGLQPSSATSSPTISSDPTGPTTDPTTDPTTGPTPEPAMPLSPLTGRVQEIAQPVLVVKLDNTRNSQPHAGLKEADVVYIEEVEYGITRLAAVFSSTVPERIGPVRSARITDLDLLSQYGSPGFAFSGAQQKLWPEIANSALIDLSANKAPSDYERDRARRAPYNYFFNGKSALGSRDDISVDRNIGFMFSEEVPSNGTINESARIEWSYASAGFNYDPINMKYAVRLNGERATSEEGDGLQWADTVVIQLVKQRPSVYFDRGGGNTPYADTIGQGTAIILRNGMSYMAKWSRPDANSGTTFTNELGIPIPFKPGQTWIALYDKTRDVKLKPREKINATSVRALSLTAR